MLEVMLDWGGQRVASLRELSGRDELACDRDGPAAASELLERLLVEEPAGALRRQELWALPLSKRDRLLAALHVRQFGDRIESTVPCAGCGSAFAVDFSLAALIASLDEAAAEHPGLQPDAQGLLALGDGRRFRLPSAEDERAIRSLSPEAAERALLERCAPDGFVPGEVQSLQAAIAGAGSVLDLDLPTRCALCGKEQTFRFDIVSFFFASLRRERSLLLREVHRLALAYHWSQESILRLPRSQRRAYVSFVEAERGRVRSAS